VTIDDSATADRDFDRWYRATRPSLARALLVFCGGDADVAGEAADEAMVRAYERWDRVAAMASPQGWTFRVGTNVARRRYRRRTMERAVLERFGRGAPTAWHDADGAAAADVWAAVAELDQRSQQVVAMRYVLGMREREIAETLDIATGTVSSLLTRARQTMRHSLEES